jgi:hypothetical protein
LASLDALYLLLPIILTFAGAIMRFVLVLLVATDVASCAIERAQIAQDARTSMIGMTKEQALACMGPPANKGTEGATEVWSYPSGNGRTAGTYGNGTATSTSRFCTVNLTMTAGRISDVSYLGPTGGFLTAGEQCAFAIQNCVKK